MIEHKELKQGSPEWLAARVGKISGSKVKEIMSPRGLGKTGHTYALKILAERLIGEPEEIPITHAMQWGIDHEDEAREIYESFTGNVVEEIGGWELGDLWGSPDGLVGDDGIIEIKCPQPKKHLENLIAKTPDFYMAQLQFNMFVSGRRWVDFITYNPMFGNDTAMKITRVEYDQEYCEKMVERIDQLRTLIRQYNGEIFK